MTHRSEIRHRVAEFRARLQVSIATRLFSRSRRGLDGLVKRLMKADKTQEHRDPELEHPA